MLNRRTRDPELSDDLHQETFLVVLAKIKQGKVAEPAKLGGYIHRVAINLVIAGYRKFSSRRREDDETGLDQIEDRRMNQLEEICIDEEVRQVRDVIGQLGSERDRQILFRFYVAEQEKGEIMADLGLDSLHFNRVLYRARQRFAERWKNRVRASVNAALFLLVNFWGMRRDNVTVIH